MKKLLVKAVNRAYPDNIGDYLFTCLNDGAYGLGVELVRVPTEKWYTPPNIDFKLAAKREVAWVNEQNADGFLFFSNWVGGGQYRHVARQYRNMDCPCVFWSREDPNHFSIFLQDAEHVDIIGTCASECIPKYQERYPNKKVISLPMAVAPSIFHSSAAKYWLREWDIVFLGNRYMKRYVRSKGEETVIIAAANWALKNDKKMGVWGIKEGLFGWESVPEIYETGIFQGGRVDRLQAADIYRNTKVALSIASNDWSPTMAPNRVVQIAGTGTILLAYFSPAAEWQTDGSVNLSSTTPRTEAILDRIFLSGRKAGNDFVREAVRGKEHVLEYHTFKHRLESIMGAIDGIK